MASDKVDAAELVEALAMPENYDGTILRWARECRSAKGSLPVPGERAPTMDIGPGIGDRRLGTHDQVVVCLRVLFCFPTHGYPHDRTHANERLRVGDIYTVRVMEVGQSSSRVQLEEVPGEWFNSVMFTDWPEAQKQEAADE